MLSRTFLAAALAATVGCGGNGSGSGNVDKPDLGAQSEPDLAMTVTTTTMTIADAIMNKVTTPITVTAYVTAVRSNTTDKAEFYIEDPAGGAYAGIDVFCDHGAKKPCAASIMAPALHSLATVTGTISAYKGKNELDPTAVTMTSMTGTAPPIPTVATTDLSPSGMSKYVGTLVKLATKVTVDDVTPTALYDSSCAGDAGVNGSCSGCAPPTYSGFEVVDGSGNKALVENAFYSSEHLASSPECLTQPSAVPVHVATTFSAITGILDYDIYGSVQVLEPVQDSDYTTP